MSTSDPEGWTISEYKSFKATGDDDSSTDGDSEDEEEEQIFAKSSVVRKPTYKKIVQREELLPE